MEEARPRAAIFDMDGTLCDVRSIVHFVERGRPGGRDFKAFHAAPIDCPPHAAVVDLARALHETGVEIVIVTAREGTWADLTARWLQQHDVTCSEIFTRPEKNRQPDHVVKRRIAEQVAATRHPVLAVDDRPDIATLWQELGIPTCLVDAEGTLLPPVAPPGVVFPSDVDAIVQRFTRATRG